MATIEEKIIQECLVTNSRPNYVLLDDVVRFATEQDRIARQEERERCINAVQDAFCNEKQCKKFWICDSCCDKVMVAINGIKNIDKNGKNKERRNKK